MDSRGSSFVFLLLLPASVIGCGGYSYELLSLKTVDTDNNLLDLENISVTMDNNCEVEVKGCTTVRHDMDNFMISYNLTFGDNEMENTRNGCEIFEIFAQYPQLVAGMRNLKLPEKCPVKKGKYCVSTKHSISKYQGTMGMFAGDILASVKFLTSNHIGHFQYQAKLTKIDT